MRRYIHDGLDEAHAPRSNRRTGRDDRSMLGRGHGFGPHSSGRGRDNRAGLDVIPGEDPPPRNYGRVAGSAPGRPMLEEDRYPYGSVKNEGYGSRGRGREGRRRAPGHDRFDGDLKR